MSKKFSYLWILTFLFVALPSLAQNLEVVRDTYILRDSYPSAPRVYRVESGRKLVSVGMDRNGFVKLESKTGASLWISKKDVRYLGSKNPHPSDLSSPTENPNDEATAESPTRHKFSWDIALASGRSNDVTFIELQGGINYYVQSWLIFRNAPFYRFSQGSETSVFGLDSSLQVGAGANLGEAAAAAFRVGAGYRLVSAGGNAPFLESGINFALGPVSLSTGVKYIMHSIVSSGAENETLLTIGFSGSGGGTF